MQVTQIATQINEWLAEKCGDARFDEETAANYIVREDLANIVDIGTRIYNNEWQDNFVKAMIDRIGRMVLSIAGQEDSLRISSVTAGSSDPS